MSKELEALKILKANAILFDDGTDFGASMLEAICDIEKSLTPPTADEVCKALSEYYKEKAFYNDTEKTFYFMGGKIAYPSAFDKCRFVLNNYSFPPSLITLIGRFYQGLEESKK